MTDRVILRCEACGNAKIVGRENTDPPGARFVVTNECDVCDAATGGFGQEWYYDKDGKHIKEGPE